ncbi:MAG: hypothetical protein ATN35_06350 [Epulopiscium sp. Nele67-Bin004]|nr:MAG: hypothetical protein ATN35_06350 [Epulopiscium sp. Nele67-Bin004]
MKKKLIVGLLACSVLVPLHTTSAYTILHTISDTQTITSGVEFTEDRHLTDIGWLDVFTLKIDLSNDNVTVKPIGASSLGEKQTVFDMVNYSGAIAGINGDFYDTSSNVQAFGPMFSDGEALQVSDSERIGMGPAKNMATAIIDNNMDIYLDFFDTTIKFYNGSEYLGDAVSYNKIPTSLTAPILFDNQYMEDTSQIMEQHPWAYTVVIKNGIIVDHLAGGMVTNIPQDGYVLVMDQDSANRYFHQLQLGSEFYIEMSAHINQQVSTAIENIYFGIGGGGLILKDGQKYTGATHIVGETTANPRTVIATTNVPNEIMLMVIDGRGTSIGATHDQIVEILMRYRAVDAMYLDGGGSSTMVAREAGSFEAEIQNSPSDGSARAVMNGVGVFTTSETGQATEILVKLDSDRVFMNENIIFDIKAVDENNNPVEVDPDYIDIKAVGINGRLDNQTFIPTTAGKGLFVVTYKGIEAAVEVTVSEKPIGLIVEPSSITLDLDVPKMVNVYGIDKDGYKIKIDPSQLTVVDNAKIVAYDNDFLRAVANGVTKLDISYGGATAQLGVVVGDKVIPIDSFEQNTPIWGGDTVQVTGSIEEELDTTYHGERAIKMTYTFGESQIRQVAYADFDTPIPLPNDVSHFNIWVYGQSQGDTLKIEVMDNDNNKFYLKLADAIDFIGWKYLSTALPENISMPARVTKIYTSAQNVVEPRTSSILFDHSSVTRGHREETNINYKYEHIYDYSYQEEFENFVSTEQIINFMGVTTSNSASLDEYSSALLQTALLKDAARVFVANNNNNLELGSIGMYNQSNFAVTQIGSTQVVQLNTDSKSLVKSGTTQLDDLKNTLAYGNASNIIIFTKYNPLTGFSDQREGELLHDILLEHKEQTGKNIFVVTYSGAQTEVVIEDGIRYINTSGIVNNQDDVLGTTFVQFRLVGDEIYYTFKGIR